MTSTNKVPGANFTEWAQPMVASAVNIVQSRDDPDWASRLRSLGVAQTQATLAVYGMLRTVSAQLADIAEKLETLDKH